MCRPGQLDQPRRDLPRLAAIRENLSAPEAVSYDMRIDKKSKAEEDADFDAFVAGSSARLLRVATLLTGDRGRSEDLVQDAYVKAYLRWNRIRAEDPWAYVRRCLVNANTDWWRRKPWREETTEQLPEVHGATDPAEALTDRVTLAFAVAQLAPNERAVLVLWFYQDLTEAQIADTLGMALGTVKSTKARAITKLRSSAQLSDQPVKGIS